MIFDTDIIIWIQRGNTKAAHLIDEDEDRCISVQTYLELLQCAQNKRQQDCVREFLHEFGFRTLPFSENIGHRATVYVEQYSLSHGVQAADALIAATAAEHNLTLCSGNAKHFTPIRDLKLHVFKP